MMRGLRIHLSTALVLMLIAAVFLGVNLMPRKVSVDEHIISYRGWPNVFWVESTFDFEREWKEIIRSFGLIRLQEAERGAQATPVLIEKTYRLSATNKRHSEAMERIIPKEDVSSLQSQRIARIVKNGVVGFFLIVVVGIVIEWRLRRATQSSRAQPAS